jgi:PPIC-type PPIASE domain
MRRVVLLVLGLALTGCAELRDAFSARPGNVARAAGQTLSVERLAELSARVKGLPLQAPNLSQLAGAYVNYLLFAGALADGHTLRDSSLVVATMWPELSQMKFDHFVDHVSVARELTGAEVDSAYRAGNVRAFQHILITVPQSAAPPVVQQKQAQVNTLWRGLVANGGGNFAAVARRSSEDISTKPSGGYLDVGARGRFVKPFDDAAWQLSPGEISGVVRSPFGFHIIRRPPLAEIRDTFAAGLRQIATSEQDSTYFADLAKRKDIRLSSGAGEAVRAAVQDLGTASSSGKVLARYVGGDFTVANLVRWLYAVDPRVSQQIPMANDSMINSLLRQLVERTVALKQADSAKIDISADEWTEVRTEYDSTLSIIRTLLGIDSVMPGDSAATTAGRERFVVARVDAYFDRAVNGQAQFYPIPPLLALELRRRGTWSIDAAAVQRAVQRAQELRASADSLRPPGAGGGGVRPAPGPAPLQPVPDSAARRTPPHRSLQ